MSHPAPRTIIVLALALAVALTAGARPAAAQLANALTGTTTAASEDTALGGFDAELTLSDSSGLNTVGENYRNELSLYFEPRWAAGRKLFHGQGVLGKLSLSGRFVLTRALSGTGDESFGSSVSSGPLTPCSPVIPSANGGVIDPTQVQRCRPQAADRRTDYSDVWLTAGLPRFATIPRTAIDVSASLRVALPTSLQSRFQTLRLGLTGTGGLSRAFLDGKLRLSYTLGLSENFHAFSTPGLDPGPGGPAGDVGGNPGGGLSGTGISNLYADPTRVGQGGYNTSYSLANSLSAHYELNDRWSADVLYLWSDGFTYSHRCVVDAGAGLVVDSCQTGAAVAGASGSSVESRGHKRGQVFWVTASYSYRPWLNLSLAWVTWAPREKPDTSYRQPFVSVDYNSFTSVMLSATTSLEELAKRWHRPSKP
jgi:hypothetical protein